VAISETAFLLAGGTAVLSILFGVRVALRALAGGAAAPRSDGGQATGGSGSPDVPGVIALPPLIFLGFLAAAAVLEAIMPLPVAVAHSLARYVAGAVLAVGGLVMIATGTRRFAAAGTNVPPTLPTTALVVDGIYRRTRNPLYLGLSLIYLGLGVAAGEPVGDRAAGAAAVGDQCRRREAGGALSGAQVWRRLPRLQGAGATVDLMGCVRARTKWSSKPTKYLRLT
jgi:hypothetical protein